MNIKTLYIIVIINNFKSSFKILYFIIIIYICIYNILRYCSLVWISNKYKIKNIFWLYRKV